MPYCTDCDPPGYRHFHSIRDLRDWLTGPGPHDGPVTLGMIPGVPYGGTWDTADQAEAWLIEFLGDQLAPDYRRRWETLHR